MTDRPDDERHLGDRLSALLDGEMDPLQEARALAHLGRCRVCSDELEAVRTARDLVRALPALDPPVELGLPAPRPAALVGPGRRDRTATAGRPRTVLWRGIAVLTASAAASVAVLNVASPRQPPVRPALDQLVEAHAASASEDEPFTQLVPAGVRVRYQP